MKILLSCFFSLFIFINTNSQDFEYYYEKAKEDYHNEIINSPFYDKAIETCPDIKKHPDLLKFKGIDLFFSGEVLLAIKYLELAKLYTTNEDDYLLIINNLGIFYSEIEQKDKAYYYYKETLKKATELGDELYITESSFNILMDEFLYATTKPSLDKFWEFYYNLEDKTAADKFEYLNIIYDYNIVKEQYDESTKLKKYIYENFKINDFENGFISYFHQNNAYLSIGLEEYDDAIKHNDSSYAISKKHLGKSDILDDLYIYKDIYEGKKDFKNTLKYVDSIQLIEEELKKANIKSNLKIVDENILFSKVKKNVDTKINSYKTIIIIACAALILFLIFYFIRNKKQKENITQLNTDLSINKGKYNKSLRDNIKFKKDLKSLFKEKKFSEASKLYKEQEINDFNNETYITYLTSEIEPTFINKLKKCDIEFSDVEKIVLFYKNNNYSNKEIALITNRTIRSIQSLSYRLNKRMQSKTDKDLVTFLKKL